MIFRKKFPTTLFENNAPKFKLKLCKTVMTVSILLVLNSFINRRLTTKSIGHASKPYSNAGKHLLRISCKITSSVARLLFYQV